MRRVLLACLIIQAVVGAYNKGPVSGNPAIDTLSATNCRANTVTTENCTITVTNGEQILFATIASAGGASMSGSSACNGTWTASGTTANNTQYFTASATATGTCTATLTATSGTLGLMGVTIKSTSGIDVQSGATSQGFKSANTSFNCPAVTTGVSNDLVVCAYVDSDTNQGTPTAGSGFTTATSGTLPTMGFESETKAAAGAITPTWAGISTGATPNTSTVAYKP